MNVDAVIESFLHTPQPSSLGPFLLQLARDQEGLISALDRDLVDPLDRALCGLQPAPEEPPGDDLGTMIRWARARTEDGHPPPVSLLAELESRAVGDAIHWVPAARLHAASSVLRENQARMALSEQSLPYVFPGTLDPMQVELLAVGERILPALHVDWVRKLTGFVVEGLVLDLKCCGGWFWPLLEVLEGRKSVRSIRDVAKRPRRAVGGLGMLGAYLSRLGESFEELRPKFDAADALLVSVAVVGERPVE